MSVDNVLVDAEERMAKAIGVLTHALGGIRTGRANPGLVDSVRVEAYGSQSPRKQLASVTAPEPSQLVIRPYDAGTIKDIEKAIVASDLGLNPQNDGKIIRINIPPLSTEVRKKMVARITNPRNILTIGNPRLKNAKAWNYEMNASVFGNEIGLFTVSGFYRVIDDMFHTVSGLPGTYDPGNPGSLLDTLGITWRLSLIHL